MSAARETHAERLVRVLDFDPELAAGLERTRLQAGRDRAVAPVRSLDSCTRETSDLAGAGSIGVLILTGLIARDLCYTHGHAWSELLGPGDLIHPWFGVERYFSVPFDIRWELVEPGEVAVLDREFATRIAEFPEIVASLVQRSVMRTRRLGTYLALAGTRTLEERLHALLWLYADRWGTVTPEGVVIPVRLPHRTLAAAVSANRSSVSVALGSLRRRGLAAREGDHWVLRGDPPGVVEAAPPAAR